MNKRQTGFLLLFFLAVIVCVIFGTLFFFGGRRRAGQTVVGFVTLGTADEKGWNGVHIAAVRKACDDAGAKLLIQENVKEFSGECLNAVRTLINQGATIVFLNSYNYLDEIGGLLEEYPNVSFYAIDCAFSDKENVTTYYVRMYQARYLSGIAAGRLSKTGRIGYVAAMDNTQVDRGINAFTLGVRSVNPEAEVVVAWTGGWDNSGQAMEAVRRLKNEKGVDMVAYHQDRPFVLDAAEEEGILSIGYHEIFEGYSENYLCSVMGNWEMVYRAILREYMQGKANSTKFYWIGLEQGAVKLAPASALVTAEIINEVESAARRIRNGRDVFTGEIRDIDGNIRCRMDETMTDKSLLEMDWFVEGVTFLEEE